MSRVALIGENSIEYVNTLIDIWNNNDCAVLIDWQIPFQSAVNMMRDANVDKCFIENKLFKKICIPENSNIQFCPYEVPEPAAKLLPEEIRTKYRTNFSHDDAVVIYSSGTTGKSKGIILSHYAITTNADAIIDYMKPAANDCIYTVRPFIHSSTLTGELLVALRSECKLLLSPTIVPPRYIFGNINRFQVTILGINPFLLSMLSKEYKRNVTNQLSLKTIYSSGSILNNEIFQKSKIVFDGINIYNVYGLTEAGPRVSAQRYDCCQSNSVGKAIKGIEIVVVDENGIPLSHGKRGIIHVSTPSRYSGYISGKEKLSSLYKDWLNTGDIGYFDEQNELHIVGRADEVIFLGAHKIYPNDVVTQIQKYANIDECVVTMVPFHSEDILCCMYSASSEIDKEIKNKLGSVLMKYEIPKFFIKTDSLPKTRTGKISAQLVKDRILAELEGR